MPCVAGTDPGTQSLDVLVLDNGAVRDQCRFSAAELRANPALPVRWLSERGPFDLIAGPSGYGLPLVRAQDLTARDRALMSLVRPKERRRKQGILSFGRVVKALQGAKLPVVFLPGVIHLPTVPAYRKINRVDFGTADKLAVAALALDRHASRSGASFSDCDCCVIELGSVFAACMVLSGGRIVDGVGGTGGPPGWRSAGAWDGEAAYLLSPLSKQDLFEGGALAVSSREQGRAWFREALAKTVGGLQAVTRFDRIFLSGRLVEAEPTFVGTLAADLRRFGTVQPLESLPGAWVKHAAQGAAILADGLAGGKRLSLVEHLKLRAAAGTVLDWLCQPRADEMRRRFERIE
jgi:predicted butyrate kinase (DUF1464 family)